MQVPGSNNAGPGSDILGPELMSEGIETLLDKKILKQSNYPVACFYRDLNIPPGCGDVGRLNFVPFPRANTDTLSKSSSLLITMMMNKLL